MCGIVGYVGEQAAAPILLEGLSMLEYRGYDSAGIAVINNNELMMKKTMGRLKVLYELTHGGEDLPGSIGIGHTRWATHGSPSEVNAHPHFNKENSIVVVHNGIIENYMKLKLKLEARGYEFVSQTDTEVLAHMLDYYYNGNPLETINKIIHRVEGSYALGIMFKDFPDRIYATRKDSPLIVGLGKKCNFIASDVPAILKYTRNVVYVQNEEIAILDKSKVDFFNSDAEPISKESVKIEWDIHAAEKGGYEHFMLKEIHEQSKAVHDTLSPRIKRISKDKLNNKLSPDEHDDSKPGYDKPNNNSRLNYDEYDVLNIDELNIDDEFVRNIDRLYIVACGSAYHTGVTGKYVFEGLSRIPVDVDLASEFRYRNPIMSKNSLVIVISQSGETADTLAALREAKRNGVKVLGIVNVVGSSIARESDFVFYTWAGPEIAVATTKAYSTQLIALYLLAIRFGQIRGTVSPEQTVEYIEALKCLAPQIDRLLADKDNIQRFASRYVGASDVFFIGRGIDYAISLEGSLKLKEISYIHSEAYAAGELKHGTISLIEEGTLVAAVLTQEALYKKMISNIVEVRTRGAFVLAITNEGNTEIENVADYVIYIPKTSMYFTNSLAIIPLQLFSYYISVGKGCDVDKPRNLAKSVTVE